MQPNIPSLLNTKARRKLLARIRLHAVLNFTNDLSPRAIWAMSAALITLIIAGIVDGFGGLFLLLPCIAFVVCYLCGKSPLSWSEVLEADLADYEPLDVEAFRYLQVDVAGVGCIDQDAFARWFSCEIIALESVEGAVKNSPRYRFLGRKF